MNKKDFAHDSFLPLARIALLFLLLTTISPVISFAEEMPESAGVVAFGDLNTALGFGIGGRIEDKKMGGLELIYYFSSNSQSYSEEQTDKTRSYMPDAWNWNVEQSGTLAINGLWYFVSDPTFNICLGGGILNSSVSATLKADPGDDNELKELYEETGATSDMELTTYHLFLGANGGGDPITFGVRMGFIGDSTLDADMEVTTDYEIDGMSQSYNDSMSRSFTLYDEIYFSISMGYSF